MPPVHDSAFATPATNREIGEEVHLSVNAVKARLRTLFEPLGLDGLPQNQKRARLAAVAMVNELPSAPARLLYYAPGRWPRASSR